MVDLVRVAAELRARAGQVEPPYSTRQIVDACFPDAVVTGRSLPSGIDEVVSRTDSGVVIVYNRGLPTSAQRFAIAHALAHVLFDVDVEPDCTDEEREERADAFAAELLVPLVELEPYVGRQPADESADRDVYLDQVDEIASHFGVTSALVDQRIRELAG